MESRIQYQSFDFALKCLKAGRTIQREQKEYHLSQQLIKSATSIGANIREANSAESLKDFLHKMRIAMKEANETNYWCSLLLHSGMVTREEGIGLVAESEIICRIIGKIISTTRKKIEANASVSRESTKNQISS